MVIYKTTNLLNGKFYVGKDEKNNPEYLGSGKILKLAINKNGRENFNKEILEICETMEVLNDREIYWISHLSATTLGYNIADGGTGGKTKFNTVHVYQYNKDGSFIKEWTSAAEAERNLKIDQSSIIKACKGKLLSVKGFIWSYDNTTTPFVDTRAIEVLQYNRIGELIKIWPSVSKVKEEMNIGDRQIQLTLDKLHLTAKGFIWIRKKGEIKKKITIIKSGHFGNKNAAKIKK